MIQIAVKWMTLLCLVNTMFFTFEGFAVSLKKSDDTTPTLEIGAKVFNRNCSLCHGAQGMGEGKIPLKIESYPTTNLITSKKAVNLEQIQKVVVYGGMLEEISKYSPPFGNELTWTEVESVSIFIGHLRNNPKAAINLLNEEKLPTNSYDMHAGRDIFETRCVLCHGKNGQGDGRMSKIIKQPPPYNLTKSTVNKEYIKLIISNGGEPLGRSPQMPPWGDQLSQAEIDSVSEYVISLRQSK